MFPTSMTSASMETTPPDAVSSPQSSSANSAVPTVSASKEQVVPLQEKSPKSPETSMAAVTSLTLRAPAAESSRASPSMSEMRSAPIESKVVDALVKTEVDEAKSEKVEPLRKRGVEVADVVVPKWVVGVKAYEAKLASLVKSARVTVV